MLRLFVCFLLLINITPVFAAAKTIRTINPYYYNPGYYNQTYIPADSLNALERYAMNRNYARESDLQRLERLENLAFGAVQNGDLNYRYSQVENAILSRPKYNSYKNTFRNALGNYIAGRATGITPSIVVPNMMSGYNNSYYSPQYTNSNMMQYSTSPFGTRGYRVLNQNYGSGSGVRILP